MTGQFIPFSRPDITNQEIEAVVSTLKSGWLTTGPVTAQFEQEFAVYLGDPDLHCIAVNSATAALHLSVEALGIGPGDEVLVPTWTFTSTAEVLRYVGATPILVDIDPESYLIDLEDAARKITAKTKAIMPVHFAGLTLPRTKINDFASHFGLAVIEDAAHSFPVKNEGALVGRLRSEDKTATVCFSFYATKTMTTGEGGMVVTKDPSLAKRMKTMRLHGISRDVFDRYTSRGASWYYEVIAPGYKYNLTDLASALGLVQLKRAQQMADRRREIAAHYLEHFADLPVGLPVATADPNEHAWHLFPLKIRSESGLTRDDFINRMAKHDIGCSVHFIPLHLHPYYQQTYGYQPEDLPNAYRNYQQEVSIPLFSSQTPEEVKRVVQTVRKILS